jgi:uncharacterized protein
MLRALGRLFLGAALFALAAIAFAADGDPIPVPKLTAHVVDLTGTLTADERSRIDSKLAEFERSKGSQVVVLLVPSIGTEALEDFATRVTDAWQLGRKGVDDGVLFVIAKQERKMRIHTGRGVQGTLTDILAKRIVADVVAPRFRTGDFAGGISEAVDAIMKAIEGEALPLPSSKPQGHKVDTVSSYGNFLWIAFFLVPVVAMVLRGLVGRFLGAGLTGGVTGLAAAWIFGSIVFGVFAAIVAFVVGLFMGTGLPGGRGGGWGGSWGGGGWSGGGGGGFSGGGGMSGGGGGFDGGGASGDW